MRRASRVLVAGVAAVALSGFGASGVDAAPTPTAVSDSATVDRFAGPTSIDVLVNDTNPDGGPKTITDVTQPVHGTAVIAADGGSVSYAPTGAYCNSDQTGNLPTDAFSYTLNGVSTATVSVKVTAPNEKPRLATSKFVTQKNGTSPTRDILQLNNAAQNTVGNGLATVFDASNVLDPSSCAAGSLAFNWKITYINRAGTYAVSGITGYDTSVLRIVRNSLLNDAGGVTFKVTVTSLTSGLIETYPVVAVITGSALTVTIFNQCQSVPQGDPTCSIPAAGPVPTIIGPVLTVNATATGKVYGAADPVFTPTVTGFRNGDAASTLSGTATCSRALGEFVSGGPYPITCTRGTLAADGYTFATGTSAPFFITSATLSVDAAAATKTYGTADPTLTATYSGFVGHDTAANTTVTGAPACTRATGESVAGGPYTITCTPGTLTAPNYVAATGNTAPLSINRAALTLVPDAGQSIVYGTGVPALTGTVVGIRNGDAIGATFSSAVTATSPVGPYPITSAAAAAPTVLDNYDIAHSPATVTVTKAPLTITPAASQSVVYGVGVPTLTGTVTGVRNGDQITGTFSSPVIATTNVGTYPITSTAVGDPTVLANYTSTLTPGTVAVTKASLSVTPSDLSRDYSAPNPTLTGVIVGVANGDPITASYTTGAGPTSPIGGYQITATLHDVHGELANYQPTLTTGTLTVRVASSMTGLTVAPNPSVLGSPVTLTATVAPVAPATAIPKGTVTFLDGTTVLGVGTLNAQGTATWATTAQHAGTRTLTAWYGGDSLIAASRSAQVTQTIQKAPTRIVAAKARLVVTVNVGRLRVPTTLVRLSAVLDRPDSGAKLAGQQLVFSYGSAVACTATTDATGTAQCDLPFTTLPALIQARGYTVRFAPTPDYLASTANGASI